MSFTDEARETFAHAEGLEVNAKLSIGSKLPLSNQEKAIAELHETINQFAGRLKPLLTPVNEVNRENGMDAEKDTSISPLAQQMEANNRGIHRASDSLRGLMERLEC